MVQFLIKKGRLKGFSLVEVLLAVGLLGLVFLGFASTLTYGQESSVYSGNQVRAVLLAKEGLEAVRNIRDEDFGNLSAGTYGLSDSGGEWNFSGTSDVTDTFTRVINISEVDADRIEVASTVTWQQGPVRNGSIELVTYLTNWQVAKAPGIFLQETFPSADSAWNGTADTGQDAATWFVYQGNSDSDDVQVSDEDNGGSSPSGGTHLTFEDTDDGFNDPEDADIAYIAIDLSDYEDVTISYYWQADDVDEGEGMRVAYSTDTTDGIDGAWTQIAEYIDPTDDVWFEEVFDLPDVDAVSTFVLRFSSYSSNPSEHMYVDDITFSGISNDVTAPATISDLALSGATETSIDLDWTAPGDDGSSGTATSYDVRYSTSLITEANWSSAIQATGEPAPSAAGSSESMTVSGLSGGTTYYFAMKTSDDAGNISSISNVPSLATTALIQIIFEETFPAADGAWNGTSDTSQDEATWFVYQGSGDSNDVQVSNEDSGASPSGGTHLTFEDADNGFSDPQNWDQVYIPIDLSGYNTVEISYYWQTDDVDGNEGFRSAYSTDTTDGRDGTWTQIDEHINPTDDTWFQDTFSLPDIDATSTFVLRFAGDCNRTDEHIYIDDIVITGYPN
jgi:Tfp pilus assembly protein PilV